MRRWLRWKPRQCRLGGFAGCDVPWPMSASASAAALSLARCSVSLIEACLLYSSYPGLLSLFFFLLLDLEGLRFGFSGLLDESDDARLLPLLSSILVSYIDHIHPGQEAETHLRQLTDDGAI